MLVHRSQSHRHKSDAEKQRTKRDGSGPGMGRYISMLNPPKLGSTSGAPAYAPPPPSERALCVDETLEAGWVDWEMGGILNLYEFIVCLILFIKHLNHWIGRFSSTFWINLSSISLEPNVSKSSPKRPGRVKSFQRWMPHWNGRATASDFHVEQPYCVLVSLVGMVTIPSD